MPRQRLNTKLLHDIAEMSYEDAKSYQAELEEEVDLAGKTLKAFPRGAMNLVAESVRMSPEYRTARGRGDRAFAELQKFNSVFTKVFAKEIREERNERYAKRLRRI